MSDTRCTCTCFLCATYDHNAVTNTWWVRHTKACPERIDSYVQIVNREEEPS